MAHAKTREGDLVDARLLRVSVRLQVALLAPQQSLIAQGYELARREVGTRKRTMCRARAAWPPRASA